MIVPKKNRTGGSFYDLMELSSDAQLMALLLSRVSCLNCGPFGITEC